MTLEIIILWKIRIARVLFSISILLVKIEKRSGMYFFMTDGDDR